MEMCPSQEDSILFIAEAPSSSDLGSSTENIIRGLEPKEELASLKVRQKYGLSASQPEIKSALSHSRSYEEIFMNVDDSMVNFSSATDEQEQQRQHGRERAALLAIFQSLARRVIDELVVTGLTMESEHPLLDTLCRMIEITLHHGLRIRWGRKNALWNFVEGISQLSSVGAASLSAIENVKQFVTLTSGSARVRAWILLALMNKCLAKDLELLFESDPGTLIELYEEWALARSEHFNTLVCLLGSLEAIDFNLYVKEHTIDKAPFSLDWSRFISPDGVHFDAIDPPLVLPAFLKEQFITRGYPDQTAVEAPDPEKLLLRVNKLEEENRQLRRSIISQLNQRSFFEEESAKLSRRLAKAQAHLDALSDTVQQMQATERLLRSTIEAHEATNQSLQYQLIQAQYSAAAAAPSARTSLTDLSHHNQPHEQNDKYVLSLEERMKQLQQDLEIERALKEEYKLKLLPNNKA